ncbi:MAG TPA: ABC transporter permease [Candidatus Saccharibacteria bacterium]|nr:ABC transporter permease [Candidatus Saccharibacteria bacterium]
MRMLDIITRAGRSLKNAKARTLLTSLAIAVGAFTLTITLAAGNGIREYTDRLIANNFDPAESIVGRDKEVENTGAPDTSPKEYDSSVANVSFGGGGGSMQVKQVTDKDIKELKSLSYVESVRPNYEIAARYITRTGQKKYTLSLQAYNPGQKPETEAGSAPTTDVVKGTVLLPKEYVKLLKFDSAKDAIGKTVKVTIERPFTEETLKEFVAQSMMGQAPTTQPTQETKTISLKVAAVTKKGAAALSPAGLPLLLNAKDAKSMYDYTTKGTNQYGKYLYASVRIKGGENDTTAAAAKKKLKKLDYYVMTSQELQQTIGQFVDVLQILVGVFGVITVIASVFGIINTMYISVLERTREIGLMKALGMRGRSVAWLFRLEAAWIGMIGGVLGALGAFVLGVSLNPWITKTLSLGKGNDLLIFDLAQIVGLIVILTVVAIVAGWLPARKAAKLDPIEALRTE